MLDIAGGSCALGTNIQQYSSNGSRAQRWIAFPSVPGGSFQLQSAVLPDLVLDVAGGSSSNGANIQTYASNGTAAQNVRFVSAVPDVAPPTILVWTAGSLFLWHRIHLVCLISPEGPLLTGQTSRLMLLMARLLRSLNLYMRMATIES